MSVRERQQRVVNQALQTAPLPLTQFVVNRLGDESPQANRFSIECSSCAVGSFSRDMHITLTENEEGEWFYQAQAKIQQHMDLFHKAEK